MKILFLKKLKFRALILGLVVIIPLIIGNFYATRAASTIVTKEAKKRFNLQSKLLADDIHSWHDFHSLALLNLSKEIELIGSDSSKEKILLDVIVNTYEDIYFAHTMNLDGWDIVRNDNRQSQYYGDSNYFTEAIVANKISSQALIDHTINKPALCSATPTLESAQIIKVTSICSDLKALTQRLNKLKLGETGYAFVVDQNASVLIHPRIQLLSGDNLINLGKYPPVKNILQGHQGYFSFTDQNHVKWASHSIRLNNGWTLIIQQQETEFLAQKIQLQNLSLLISGIVIFGIAGLTLWLSNRLSTSINNFANTTSSNNDFEEQITIQLPYELVILPNSSSTGKNLVNNSVE